MRRAIVTVLTGLFLAVTALPAGAVTTPVSMVDFAFSPGPVTIKQGGTVQWHNNGTRTHTATQDAPLSNFNTGNVAAGATSAGKVLNAAGIYPYHCTIHPSMVGTVKVPVKVAPTTGTTATVVTITLATQAAPTGFVDDVQLRWGWSLARVEDPRDDGDDDVPGHLGRALFLPYPCSGRSRPGPRASPRRSKR